MVYRFFARIARTVAKQGLGDVALACMDPTGFAAVNYLGKIGVDIWNEIREDNKQAKLHQEIEEAASATFEAAKQAGLQEAQAVTDDPELQGHIVRIVSVVPASIRTSLSRPEDPSGRSLPKNFQIHDEQDIVRLLPVRLSRFKPGDNPPWLRGWRLVELIGVGGFGEVWKVQSTRAANLFGALKIGNGLTDKEFSLLNEGDVLNRLLAEGEHDGIVPLQDLWADGDPIPWIRFKYIDGGDLSTHIHHWQSLAPSDRLAKVTTALSTLARTIGYFHRLQPKIVHRDLKPSNILVESRTGKVLISDFGIGAVSSARAIDNERGLSQSQGAVIATCLRGSHTPIYASPQQKKGSRLLDPRDDVHALGVIAYQMLTGQLDAAPGVDLEEELKERAAPKWVIELIKRCVAREPSRRPADGQEINEIIARESLPSTSSPGSTSGSSPRVNTPSISSDIQRSYQELLKVLNQGHGTKRWLEKQLDVISDWERAAKQGVPEAMLLLGVCHEVGVGVAQDYAEAMKWYRKAADAGNGTANYAEAIKWYRKAADTNNALAMNNIGWLYHNGWGVAQNITEAMKWYRKGADAGDGTSLRNIGWLYQYGHGVTQDYTEAIKWYRKAADTNNGLAMNDVGWLYHNGWGVAQDYTEAMKWYRKAADASNGTAMNNIGWLYHYGMGVKQDKKEARRWYEKAIQHGNEKAKENLKQL
ncbi:MAG: hypothetical protein EBV06_04555 [Planctomycetia bacterium]|nr:hypothetical protein [Planctomycetia bacterium]